MSIRRFFLVVAVLLAAAGARAQDAERTREIAELLGTSLRDSPAATMQTFYEAMERYRKRLGSNDDEQATAALDHAVGCLNLDDVSALTREDVGRESAILLKEFLDRVVDVDYLHPPEAPRDTTWTVPNTDVTIARVGSDGPWLFTPETVTGIRGWYELVSKLDYLPGRHGAGYRETWVERQVPEWAKGEFMVLQNWQWLGIFLAVLVGLVIKIAAERFFLLVKKVVGHSRNRWDDRVIDALDRPIGLAAASAFWFFSVYALRLSGPALTILLAVVKLIFSISLIWGIYRLVDILSEYLAGLTSKSDNALDDTLVPMIQKALRITVLIFGVLVAIQNLGFNVVSVLAGLGLGGLALALAAQDTCANFFGSVNVLFDRPFNVGDWIIVSGNEGTVEEIGFRSTRIRTFYNSQVTIPNSVIAGAAIDNMGRRRYRRVKLTLGLTYDTPAEKLEAFVEGIKNIIKANKYTRKDYYHVVFNGYGACSLDILVYCFVEVPDWARELVERQHLLLEFLRLAKELEVDFAFPTRTLHMETFPEKQSTRAPHRVEHDELVAAAAAFGPEGAKARPDGLGYFTPMYDDSDMHGIVKGDDDGGGE